MANRAHEWDDKLANKTGRAKLPARSKPYFTSIEGGVALGYVAKWPECGHWIVRRVTGRTESASGIAYATYAQERLGAADDLAPANGETILSFRQARELASAGSAKSPMTVADAVKLYLRDLEDEKGQAARMDAEQRLNLHVMPAFGKLRIADLRLPALKEWRSNLVNAEYDPGRKWTRDRTDEKKPRRKRMAGVAAATANRIMANFKAALNVAYQESPDQLGKPIWRELPVFELKRGQTSRKDHFTSEQVLTLIDKARARDPAFADLLEAAFYTGARYGELTALDVRHFHEATRQLEIPDGKTGGRTTVLSPEGAEFFKRMAEGKEPDDVLLPRADGERWAKNHQQKPTKAALRDAKLPTSATFYALRHTHISRAIEQGQPLIIIAENVGTSVRMIEAHYFKSIQAARQKIIEDTAPTLRQARAAAAGTEAPEAEAA